MTAQDIRISRDYDNDVLYVLKNGVDLSVISNIIISENITVRMIKGTHDVVGFTIDEFSNVCPEWKDQKEYELMEDFDEILDLLNDACKRRLAQATSQAVFA
jgi:hypothetical protein